MSLPAPELDDRTFQELVDACKRMIPHYCPEWTDHNVSDPGVALIELFAWLVETMLFRLNQVPDKNYIKLMELMGIRLQPPSAAQAEITFRIDAPLFRDVVNRTERTAPVVIPASTEVATLRTETTEALVFTTEGDLILVAPTLIAFQGHPVGHPARQHLAELRTRPRILDPSQQQGVHVFSDYPWTDQRPPNYDADRDQPQADDAFYLGFAENLSHHILQLHLALRESANRGVNPSNPPLQWEAWVRRGGQARWWPLDYYGEDRTLGLTISGNVGLYLPADLAPATEIGQEAATWLRCRLTVPRPGQGAFNRSPEVLDLQAATIGGTALASHCQLVIGEELGRSNGLPGQRFPLRYSPILPRRPDEVIEVENDQGDFEPWTEVLAFWPSDGICPTCGHAQQVPAAAGQSAVPASRYYHLDDRTGAVEFAPLVREPSGRPREYGALPPKGHRLRMRRYRYGGGAAGNVGPNTITVLKQAIPYVNSEVTNRHRATGGTDAEHIGRAKLRAPQVIRTRDRAVTPTDFELLARMASPSVARAKCIRPTASEAGDGTTRGQIAVLLVPEVQEASGPLSSDHLRLDSSVQETVLTYLEERRLLTTRLVVDTAPAVGVSVDMVVHTSSTAPLDRLRTAIEQRLYRYLHPTQGWNDGHGWPFGRNLRAYDLYGLVAGLPDVLFIEQVSIFQLDGERRGAASDGLIVPPGAVLYSGTHHVSIVRSDTGQGARER